MKVSHSPRRGSGMKIAVIVFGERIKRDYMEMRTFGLVIGLSAVVVFQDSYGDWGRLTGRESEMQVQQ